MPISTPLDLPALLGDLSASLARYASVSRLYELKWHNEDLALGVSGLLVEGFAAQEEINGVPMPFMLKV